jgi:hypothetical protein
MMKQLVRITMHKQHRHPVELMGYALILLVLLGFLCVGYFVTNSQEAASLDKFLRLIALLGIVLFGLGRWVLKPSRPK